MRLFVFLSLVIILSGKTEASCQLPRGEKLMIACTYKCDFTYRFRLQMVAKRLGLPIEILDLREMESPLNSLSKIDGLLAPGGADIDPEYYLDNVSKELVDYTKKNIHLVNFSTEGKERDPFEFEVLAKYSEEDQYKNLPLLGICRGMQMMSVVQGIPLWLDIKTEIGIKNRYNRFDRVFINPENSLMQEIYKNDNFLGFKLHHQGIRVPYYEANKASYPNVRVSSYSNKDRIAESIEYLHRPALGVQYHPEKSFPKTTFPVFKWFLTKACEYRNSR